MEFVFTSSIQVPENMIDDMALLVTNDNLTTVQAIRAIAASWDDCDWYHLDDILPQLIEEVNRRVKNES